MSRRRRGIGRDALGNGEPASEMASADRRRFMGIPTKQDRLPTPLRRDDRILGTSQTVGDFWAWAYSDILDSVTRGTFAEFLVRSALSIDGAVRDNGSAF